MQNPASQEINKRFFQALARLQETGKVGSVAEFCREHGFNRSNLFRLRSEPHREFELQLLQVLVEKYGVSAEWLLTGRGDERVKLL